jgi:NTE family protein
LREALAEEIDFERLRAQSPGELRILRETELSIDMVLASAYLPLIHHAVEVLTPRA